MRKLVLGIGNPILSDDGVGIKIVRKLREHIGDIDIDEINTAGMDIIEAIADYDKVIFVDAIKTDDGKIGDVYKLKQGDFASTLHTSSPHDVNFATAIELGKMMAPDRMPKEIIVYAVEVEDITTFSEELTPKVRSTVPKVVKLILAELESSS